MSAALNSDQTPPVLTGSNDAVSPRETRVVRSEDLLAGRSEIFIEHGEEKYRLRLTRAGKLILQK